MENYYVRVEQAIEAYNAGNYEDSLQAWAEVFAYLDDMVRLGKGGVVIESERAEALANFGAVWTRIGRLFEATTALRRAEQYYESDTLANIRELDAQRAIVAMNLGSALSQFGDMSEAIEAFGRAQALYDGTTLCDRVDLDVSRARLAENLGNCQQERGELSEAVISFGRASVLYDDAVSMGDSELDSERARLAMNLGNTLRIISRSNEAIVEFQRAQTLYEGVALRNREEFDADRALLNLNLGNALQDTGQVTKAIEAYRRAHKFYEDPSQADRTDLNLARAILSTNLGAALRTSGQPADAITAYQRADSLYNDIPLKQRRELDADRASLAVNFGAALYETGKLSEAIDTFRRAEKLLENPVIDENGVADITRAKLAVNFGAALDSLGQFQEAISIYRMGSSLFDGGPLKNRPEFDDIWATLSMNLGVALQKAHRLSEATEAYQCAQELFDGNTLRGRPEFDRARGVLSMNLGIALSRSGQRLEAINLYDEATEIFKSDPVREDSELEFDRCLLDISHGTALLNSGRPAEALISYYCAQSMFDGAILGKRSEFDRERAILAMNLGNAWQLLGGLPRAFDEYGKSKILLESESLRDRKELDVERANLAHNIAEAHLDSGSFAEASQAHDQAIAIYNSKNLSNRADLNNERIKLMVSMSSPQLLHSLEEPNKRLKYVSQLSIDYVRDLPPEDNPPWSELRLGFARLHSNWMSWCVEDEKNIAMIPEVLCAVQGRELAAYVAEQLVEVKGLIPDGPLERFLSVRTELRKLLEQMHRLAATGISNVSVIPANRSSEANLALMKFSKDYAKKRRWLEKLRVEAAKEPGFAALGATREAIRMDMCQSALEKEEQLLLLFFHDDIGHALLINSSGTSEYLKLPDMLKMVKNYQRMVKTLAGRGGMRSVRSATSSDDVDAAKPDEISKFWTNQKDELRRILWLPLKEKLIEGGTLLVASAGDLHNISLEPGKPECIGTMARLPGLAYFALSRGLFGNNPSDTSRTECATGVAILADDCASDIPLASREGQHAALLWEQVGDLPEYPTDWPRSEGDSLRFLHVAGHGTLQDGLAGSKHSVILHGRSAVGESEILGAPVAREALVNICVAGQSHDNPLDGNPTGIVPGFLRHGTKWVVASLLPLPDTWALLAGLILTDLRSSSEGELPELLEVARERLVEGGWPERVSAAFSDALISVLAEPRFGPDKMPDGKLVRRVSLLSVVESYLTHVEAGRLNHTRQRLEDRFSEEESQSWWLENDPNIVEKLLAAPSKAQQTLEDTIRNAVEYMQVNGTPNIPDVDTVRYGWTLFGDPNPVRGAKNG